MTGALEERFRSLLEIPLQWTFYYEGVVSHGLSAKQLQDLRNGWEEEDLREITQALNWAAEDEDLDVKSIMPHVPYSNAELRQYLRILGRQFDEKCREWFGRETNSERQ